MLTSFLALPGVGQQDGPVLEAPAPPAPIGPLPSARQLAWHRLEYYAFVHFNMNTFTDAEWGEGVEDPDTFQPTELDCRQWARVARDAGMAGIILTAKHHDGFCLWPSAYTEHSVAASSWRDGKGDVLAELSQACREYGLRFGVYLSPWDRNHPAYGDSPRYNAVFEGQLTEVLTRYGDVFEVWFDGACGEGPNGKRQVYDWPGFVAVVREHQPDAVIFSDAGPDVRWVGNERGYAGETNWCMLRRDEFFPGTPRYAELTEGHEDGTDWLPPECDVSIRPGWYYHADQDDRVKSLDELLSIWHGSVGRGANLLLNLPVDRRGLVHENDVAALMELRRALDAIYGFDLARGATASASSVRGDHALYAASNVLDGDPDTYWSAEDGVIQASLELDLHGARLLDRVSLREYLPLGQRVRAFDVQGRVGGQWRTLASGTTIGPRRILAFPAVETDRLRIAIEDARACPLLSEVGAYLAPPTVSIDTPGGLFLDALEVELEADLPGARIRYTLDGTAPGPGSPLYTGPIRLERSCTLRASAELGLRTSLRPATADFVRATRADLRPAAAGEPAGPDLALAVHEGEFRSLEEAAGTPPTRHATVASLADLVAGAKGQLALFVEGSLDAPRDGIYTFRAASDDGSRVWIDGELVVDNDGLHMVREVAGQVGLARGRHAVRIGWFNGAGDASLAVRWSGPGFEPRALELDGVLAPAERTEGPATYMGRRIAPMMLFGGGPWLLRANRETDEDTPLLMERLAVLPGQTVCDLGAGNGYQTLRLARLVGESGKVFAVDLQEEFLTQLRERADEAGLENIRTVLGTPTDPHLPASSCDLILMVDVYHELAHPVEMLAALRRALTPSGRMVIVEFREDEDIKPLHRMGKEQLRAEVTANGFVCSEEFDGLPRQHLMVFQRDDAPRR